MSDVIQLRPILARWQAACQTWLDEYARGGAEGRTWQELAGHRYDALIARAFAAVEADPKLDLATVLRACEALRAKAVTGGILEDTDDFFEPVAVVERYERAMRLRRGSIRFRWVDEGLCCCLCNQPRLARLATRGWVIDANDGIEIEVCARCIAAMQPGQDSVVVIDPEVVQTLERLGHR
jgi:hypothetical protein